ncbi:GNAT family N-acetyltransferase [Neobacillus ginsengisoli]|uniref:GNAT superfamily N-acetyltransferase n=1 Tax=Neobacillus ginsengisoli TaxID=904295 RepID=A0ABT9XVK8_9BACI|nr:GNAT family N-acetyltransferase [Neobacillus ginsengisoli]MDQ0199600.1 GNAT superfamily N-acetyltransferase [Neobacillus ginsengisoli]
MNITIKKLTDCTINEAVTAWNKGFEGYFVKLEMTPETFFNRLVNEGLSMNHSIIAFDQENPVGIVLNGFRIVDGKKISWNGGTGVATEHRGKGVSKLLMEEILKIYQEEEAEVATLEAIKENERAIRLYEQFGYQVVDSLVYLSGTPEIQSDSGDGILSRTIRPEQLPALPFYNGNVAWQCQWQSVKSGEAQIYFDHDHNPLGYALFKRVWDQEGNIEKVLLYQLELIQDFKEETIQAIFAKITDWENNPVNVITINASMKNVATQYLLNNGFTKTTEQVQMVKR